MTNRIFTIDFTRDFIHELAGYIDREYLSRGRSLERLAVVFGGKRPAHFLKRALARRLKKSFVPPAFFTIDEFMVRIADDAGARQPAPDLDSRYELFRLARELEPGLLSGRETFSKFLPWAGDILEFIHQLDLENVSAASLRNIQESARIGYPVPDNINRLLGKILRLREAFHAALEARGQASRGLQYLRAAGNVRAWPGREFDEIIFANFFYFHRTEEAVVKELHGRGQATLIFQGDERKWPVLERIARRLDCALREGPEPTPTTFTLKAYSALDTHSASAVARDILLQQGDLGRTLVILPDPEALVPFLSTLPDEIRDFNVSMGYPLKRSSLVALLQSVFRAQGSRRGERYYARDYLSVMRHPFVKNLRFGEDPSVMRRLAHTIEDVLKGRIKSRISGSAFVTLEEVASDEAVLSASSDAAQVLQQAHAILFGDWSIVATPLQLAGTLTRFLDLMVQKSFMQDYPLNVNISSRMFGIARELERVSFANDPFEARELFRVLEDRISREVVSFSGTPLKGLQVLGLFETRSLNFDHVIILDVNEGVLPRVNIHASLVPREVMNQLGIDRLELEEEIQRYQFMRVISGAKTVHLVYQKNREKEPSRFLEELVWEQQSRAGRLEPFPTQRSGFGVVVAAGTRAVKKTAKMADYLRKFTFSASSINTYIENPYRFYMTCVLGLREEEDLLDEPDASLVGNFLHGLLEEAFRPFVGRRPELGPAFEQRFWRLFNDRFEETFARRMRSDAFMTRAVMEHKLKAFLDHERDRLAGVARVLCLEKDFSAAIPLAGGPAAFRARVDRVDELKDGSLLVLDYKTGSSDKLPPPVWEVSGNMDRREIFETVHSFQLPLYLYFVSQAWPEAKRIEAGLYSLREAAIMTVSRRNRPVPAVREFLAPYLQVLDAVVREILSPDIPFADDELSRFERRA